MRTRLSFVVAAAGLLFPGPRADGARVYEHASVCVAVERDGDVEVSRFEDGPPEPPPLSVGCELRGCVPGYGGDGELELVVRFEYGRFEAPIVLRFGAEPADVPGGAAPERPDQVEAASGDVIPWSRSWPARQTDTARVLFPWVTEDVEAALAPGDVASLEISQRLVLPTGEKIEVNRYSAHYRFEHCSDEPPAEGQAPQDLVLLEKNAGLDPARVLLWSCVGSGPCRASFFRGSKAVHVGNLTEPEHEITVLSQGDAVGHRSNLVVSAGEDTWTVTLDEPRRISLRVFGTSSYSLKPEARRKRVRCDVAAANAIFDRSGVGLEIDARIEDDVELSGCDDVGDKTAEADVVAYYNNKTVYFGLNCHDEKDWALFIGWHELHKVLAHELGHAFSLCHSPWKASLMSDPPHGHWVTPGQAYWANRYCRSRAVGGKRLASTFLLGGECQDLSPKTKANCGVIVEEQREWPTQSLGSGPTRHPEDAEREIGLGQRIHDSMVDFLEAIDSVDLRQDLWRALWSEQEQEVFDTFLDVLKNGPPAASRSAVAADLAAIDITELRGCSEDSDTDYLAGYVRSVRARAALALALIDRAKAEQLLEPGNRELDSEGRELLEAALTESSRPDTDGSPSK